MDEQFMREVLAEIRAVREDVQEIKVVQGRQEVTLLEHTRRSTANEEALHETRQEHSAFREYVKREHDGFRAFTNKWAGAWTVLGVIGLLVAILANLGRFLGH